MNTLAVYAAQENTTSRLHNEPHAVHYAEYQRDYERILRSSAFHRLEHKNKLLVNQEGDHVFRTYLTHTLAVAQLSRAVARNLKLNEDLVEAIALASCLGYPPFGQAGLDALNSCMQPFGGFETDVQSLRIVDELEEGCPEFRGLNLTFDTREGILRRCSVKQAKILGTVGVRFLQGGQPKPPGLEAQVVQLCEGIIHVVHDIDDALYARLISIRQLREQPLFNDHYLTVLKQWTHLSQRRVVHETLRRMINEQLANVIETSKDHLDALQPSDIEKVRLADEEMITLSALMYDKYLHLTQFLQTQVYQHYRVKRIAFKIQQMIQRLFEVFTNDSSLLPLETQMEVQRLQTQLGSDMGRAKAVTDYIVQMTERNVIAEHERMFQVTTLD